MTPLSVTITNWRTSCAALTIRKIATTATTTVTAMRFGAQRPLPPVISGASTTPPVDTRAVASDASSTCPPELESTVSDMFLTGIES